jgi:hypothetical protein
MSEEQLQASVQFLKALADESRLKIISMLARRECSVEELATALGLTAPTVSHHLAKLKQAGLAKMRTDGTTHLYSLDTDALREFSKQVFTPGRMVDLVPESEGDAWQRKVLRDFFEGDRLKEIPATRKKRVVVLEWIADRFEHGREYTERQVNEIITRHHSDPATIRREFIGYGMMTREDGIYRRVPATPGERQPEWSAGESRPTIT